MKKKSLSVISAVLIAATIFASCSDSSGSKDNLSSNDKRVIAHFEKVVGLFFED
jgi:outer membrane murein-binding lipoprotein Lpp